MAANGGVRPGAGRPKGVPNRKTKELQEKVQASGLTPLDYMLDILRDVGKDPLSRFEAAKAAAPYVHARLASQEISGKDGGPVQISQIERFVVDPKD